MPTPKHALSVLIAATSLVACAKQVSISGKEPHPIQRLHKADATGSLEGPDAPPIDAFKVGEMETDAMPATTARRGTDSVTIYSRGGHLFSRRIDLKTGPEGDEVDLTAHQRLGDAGLKLVSTPAGYVLLWDEQIDQNHVLKVLTLDAAGKPVGSPLGLPPISDKLTYTSVLAFDGGLLVVHDIEQGGVNDVFVTPISADAKKALGASELIAHGVQGWDCAAGGNEAYFAVVGAAQGHANEGEPLGPVRAFTVDAHGKKGDEIHIADQDVSDIDVQVAPMSGGAAVAYTDHTEMEGAVKIAMIKNGALSVPPKRVSPPLGDAAFVEIVSQPRGTGKTALVVWENVGESSDELRLLHDGVVGLDGRLSKETGAFVVDRSAQAHVTTDGDGYAVLTLGPSSLVDVQPAANVVPLPMGDTKPAGPPMWPSFARLGSDLAVHGSEPVRFLGAKSKDGVPDVTFGLTCDGGTCSTLATSTGKPADLFLAVLPARDSRWRPIAWRDNADARPAVRESRSLMVGDQVAKVASVRLGGPSPSTLTAWTTYFVDGTTEVEPAPKGEPPYAATLAVRATHSDGTPGDTVVLSKRAKSEGGVAIAEAPGKEMNDAVIAWVANEKGTAQVYVTRLDADGKKTAQKKLTTIERKKAADGVSGASDVAIAYVGPSTEGKKKNAKDGGDGFIVAWVDRREKNGDVYVARINKDLDKVVIDKRVTTAPAEASGVDIAVRGNDIFLAYADARDGQAADIYFSRLDAETLRVKDGGRVYASRAHSHSPKLALAGDHIFLTWIEDTSETPGSTPSGATGRVAEIDTSGHLVSSPFVVEAPKPAAGASASSGVAAITFTCSGVTANTCHLAFAASLDQGQALYGLTLGSDLSPGSPAKLANLATASLTDASLDFAEPGASVLSLLEQGSSGRVRLLKLDW
jgi:hypothetical protein